LFVGWLLINIRLIIKTFILKLVSLFVIIADISLDEEVLVSRDARIHRINLKEELLTLFKNEDILKYNLRFIVIDPRGVEENGVGDGVARDVICSFFIDFVMSNTIGCLEVIPAIRHTMLLEDWKAVARIILYGMRT